MNTKKITIGCFTGCILALTVGNVIAPKKTVSYNENRTLAKAPSLTVSSIFGGNFDDTFESWFSDHFVARDSWIALKSGVKKATLNIENNDIYFGKDGYLIPSFLSYSQETVDSNIQCINTFCENNSVKANILLVPSEAYGASNALPYGSYNVDEKALFEDIQNQLSEQNVLDYEGYDYVNASLYFKTDHHWNQEGSYLGYTAICKDVLNKDPEHFTYEKVSDSFYGTSYSSSGAFWSNPDSIYRIIPDQEVEVTVTLDDGTVNDSVFFENRLNEKDQYTYYLDGNHGRIDIKTNVDNGKKALIVKDSYAHILVPYLITEYSEIEMIDLRYYHSPVSTDLTEDTDLYFIYSLDNFTEDPNLAFLR